MHCSQSIKTKQILGWLIGNKWSTQLYILSFSTESDISLNSPDILTLTSQADTYELTLITDDDNELEDYEESFSISIALQTTAVLVEIRNSTATIVIRDNEG